MSIWEQNYNAVATYKPPLLALMKKPEKDTDLKVLFSEQTARLVLSNEYKKHQTLLDQCKVGVVFTSEPYILKELLLKYPWYSNFFVVFPSMDYLMEMFNNLDMTDVIQNPAFNPIIGTTDEQIRLNMILNLEKSPYMVSGLRIFAYQPFDTMCPKLIRDCVDHIEKITNTLHVNYNTCIVSGKNIVRNSFRSINKHLSYPNISMLKDLLQGQPVVCVAAGPSLKKNIHYLKQIQNDVFIIAVAAAYKPLINAGVKPDLITHIDMDKESFKYFDDVDMEGQYAVIEMAAYYDILEKTNAKVIISQSSSSSHKYISQFLDKLGVYNKGNMGISGAMTVAFMNVLLAKAIGAGKIILIGQDLSYSSENTHASDAQLSSSVKIINHEGQDFFIFDSYANRKNVRIPVIKHRGWDGHNVPTTFQFVTYKEFLEHIIKTYHLEVINSTEGGILIGNCKNMTLRYAYEQHIENNKLDKTNLIKYVHPMVSKYSIDETLEYCRHELDAYRHIRKLSQKGINQWEKYDKKTIEGTNTSTIVNTINELHIELLDKQAEYIKMMSANNFAGFYLYYYLKNKPNSPDVEVDFRNRSRILFQECFNTSKLMIEEIERLINKLEEKPC